MFDGLLALAVPDAVAEAIADRFVAVEAVTWGDVRDAGIAGRDVVRLRKRISGDAKVGRRGVHAADWLQERRLATGDALVFVFRGVTLTGRSGGYSTPSAVGTSRAVRAVGVVPPPPLTVSFPVSIFHSVSSFVTSALHSNPCPAT